MNGTVLSDDMNTANGFSSGSVFAGSAPTSGIEYVALENDAMFSGRPSQAMNFFSSARCLPFALAARPASTPAAVLRAPASSDAGNGNVPMTLLSGAAARNGGIAAMTWTTM